MLTLFERFDLPRPADDAGLAVPGRRALAEGDRRPRRWTPTTAGWKSSSSRRFAGAAVHQRAGRLQRAPGLPMGMQLIGRPRGDLDVLRPGAGLRSGGERRPRRSSPRHSSRTSSPRTSRPATVRSVSAPAPPRPRAPAGWSTSAGSPAAARARSAKQIAKLRSAQASSIGISSMSAPAALRRPTSSGTTLTPRLAATTRSAASKVGDDDAVRRRCGRRARRRVAASCAPPPCGGQADVVEASVSSKPHRCAAGEAEWPA